MYWHYANEARQGTDCLSTSGAADVGCCSTATRPALARCQRATRDDLHAAHPIRTRITSPISQAILHGVRGYNAPSCPRALEKCGGPVPASCGAFWRYRQNQKNQTAGMAGPRLACSTERPAGVRRTRRIRDGDDRCRVRPWSSCPSSEAAALPHAVR